MQPPEESLIESPHEDRENHKRPHHGAHAESAESAPASGHTPLPTPRGKFIGAKIVTFAVIVAALLTLGFVSTSRIKAAESAALDKQTAADLAAPPAFDVARAQAAPSTEALTLPGETQAWYETTIYARVNGYIARWSADIGDHVAKGQTLATIDTPELDAQLLGAKAKLNSAKAEVEAEKANMAFAKTTLDRWWNSPKGVVSEQEREAKKADYDNSVNRKTAAEAKMNLAQAEIDQLTALSQFKKVTAPFDGVITKRQIDIGDLVTAGSTANTTSLYTLVQSDRIRVFADVPEAVSTRISGSTHVQVTCKEIPGKTFQGVVARTSRAIDAKTKTMRVEVDIPNPKQILLPGMYVQAAFNVEQPGRVQIPASALIFRSSGPQVAVVNPEGVVSFQKVSIASDQGDVIDLDSGVRIGQTLVLNVGDQITDGQRIIADKSRMIAASDSAATPAGAKTEKVAMN